MSDYKLTKCASSVLCSRCKTPLSYKTEYVTDTLGRGAPMATGVTCVEPCQHCISIAAIELQMKRDLREPLEPVEFFYPIDRDTSSMVPGMRRRCNRE